MPFVSSVMIRQFFTLQKIFPCGILPYMVYSTRVPVVHSNIRYKLYTLLVEGCFVCWQFYDLAEVARIVGLPDAFLVGAGAGSSRVVGKNCEARKLKPCVQLYMHKYIVTCIMWSLYCRYISCKSLSSCTISFFVIKWSFNSYKGLFSMTF